MYNDEFNAEQIKKLDEATKFAVRIEKYNREKSGEDTDRTIFALTYLSTENLIRHSKHLTWLTIGLLFATILLFGTAIAPIICSRTG